MTLKRAFIAILVSTLIGGIVGTLLGWSVGTFAPGFYTSMFSRPINPIHMGVGFGLNAGIFTGVTVGVLLVAIMTYLEVRRASLEESRRLRETLREMDEEESPSRAAAKHGSIQKQ